MEFSSGEVVCLRAIREEAYSGLISKKSKREGLLDFQNPCLNNEILQFSFRQNEGWGPGIYPLK